DIMSRCPRTPADLRTAAAVGGRRGARRRAARGPDVQRRAGLPGDADPAAATALARQMQEALAVPVSWGLARQSRWRADCAAPQDDAISEAGHGAGSAGSVTAPARRIGCGPRE